MTKTTEDYKKHTVEEVLTDLGTDKDKGLSEGEVLKRLSQYGYNEIPEKESQRELHR